VIADGALTGARRAANTVAAAAATSGTRQTRPAGQPDDRIGVCGCRDVALWARAQTFDGATMSSTMFIVYRYVPWKPCNIYCVLARG